MYLSLLAEVMLEQFRTRNVRKRQNERIKRIAITLAILALAAVLVGWFIMKNTAVGGAVFSSSADVPFYKQDAHLSNSKVIVYKKGGNIAAIDSKAKQVFSIGGVSDDAKIYLSESYVGYSVKNSYYIYDLSGKEVCRYETEDTIYDMRLFDGYVVLIKADASGNTFLVLNDFKQAQLFSTGVNVNNLLDYGVVSSSATVWMLSLNTNIPTPLCVFTSYNSSKGSVSSVINIAEQLVEKLLINSDKVYAVGTSNLVTYDLSGKKEQTYLTYGWEVTDWRFVGAKPYFVLIPRTDEPITSVRIRHSDSTEYTFTLQEECDKVIIGNETIYAFNSNKVFYTDLKGENIKKADMPFKMNGCESVLGGSHILADNGSSYVLLSLK